MKSRHSGQALTEFLIVTLFLLLPLFLALPLLSKMFEIQHRTQESARYMAWERTVWSKQSRPFATETALKSDDEMAAEVRSRLWLSPYERLSTDPGNQNKNSGDSKDIGDPILWAANSDTGEYAPLLTDLKGANFSATTRTETPSNLAAEIRNQVLSLLKKIDYEPGHLGYQQALVEVRYPIMSWHPYFEAASPEFSAKARLLMLQDGWASGSYSDAGALVSQLVPTSLASDLTEQTDGVSDASSIIPWLDHLSELRLGHVDTQQVPEQRKMKLGKN